MHSGQPETLLQSSKERQKTPVLNIWPQSNYNEQVSTDESKNLNTDVNIRDYSG